VQQARVDFFADGITRQDTVGLMAYLVDRVEPNPGSVGVADSWGFDEQLAVATALVARVDAGLGLTLADVNTILQVTFPGTDLTGVSSTSTGVLSELLSIMAGKGYHLGAGWVKGPGGVWSATIRGSFSYDKIVNGTTVIDGEVKPFNEGGDVVQWPVRPIRDMVYSDYFFISLNQGQMGVFSMKSGLPHPTLWPSSQIPPFFPWSMQPGPAYEAVSNARVVTVYGDDGAVI
jgi:hypothetical protein